MTWRSFCFSFLCALFPLQCCGTGATDPEPSSIYTADMAVVGYHIMEKADCGVYVWKDSLRTAKPMLIDFKQKFTTCSGYGTWADVFAEIEKQLAVKPRVEYQQPVRFFTPDGQPLDGGTSSSAPLPQSFFLLEGGQWQWPPVRKGFEHVIAIAGHRTVKLVTQAVVPSVFFVSGLVTGEEAEGLIAYAKPRFKESNVIKMDNDLDGDTKKYRTSLDYRPKANETALITTFQARAASLTKLPSSHQEELQILKYDTKGFYHAHDDASNLIYYAQNDRLLMDKHYGYFDRMLTLFWYLNTVPEGGETNFPVADGAPWPKSMASCSQGLIVKAEQGAAVLWYNMDATGIVSKHALHAGCKVLKGTKYAINAWIHNKPRSTPIAKWDPKHPRMAALGRGEGKDDAPDDGTRHLTVNTDTPIKVFWKNEATKEEVFMLDFPTIPTGKQEHERIATQGLNTHRTHVFVARDRATNEILSEYRVSNKHRAKNLRWDILTSKQKSTRDKKEGKDEL
ncbi:unnamed protein product [Amoebophrya sp. A120]|nr:unnamed protein product [Amoebophrya sp. A120]|eukprot:GSA120T00017902001.1